MLLNGFSSKLNQYPKSPAQCGHVHIRPTGDEFETGAGHKTWLGLRRGMAYWCTIKLLAHASQDQYGGDVVSEITVFDALERWEK